ncbi:phosphatase PAP2 family protein [Chromohalobacter beijerinckii]|uniref:undecaprenyl-diphosphate phosphatase n=2 Tax=Chromohalobacter beijerinckii TaxID=86179 RepID=A0ABV8XFB9_9GAMM
MATRYLMGYVLHLVIETALVRKEKAPAILLALTMTSISLTVPLLKFLIHESRPMVGLYENWETFSFPSGHTTLNITLYLCILLLFTHHFNVKHRILTGLTIFSLLFLICFSRVYLNAHWLTDIVGGVFLGTGWACLFFYLFLRQLSQNRTNKSSSIYFAILIASILTVWPLHSFKVFQNDVTRYTSKDH